MGEAKEPALGAQRCSPSSLRERRAAHGPNSATMTAGTTVILVSCGQLWAAVTGREPNGIQEVGSSTLLGLLILSLG